MMSTRISLTALAVIIILFSAGFSGCDSPGPLSSIPRVTIYSTENETKIFVSGQDNLYEEINITINNKTSKENFTYGSTSGTTDRNITLEVTVTNNLSDDEKTEYVNYTYQGSIMVIYKHNEPRFLIKDINNKEEVEKESPYKTIMEKVK